MCSSMLQMQQLVVNNIKVAADIAASAHALDTELAKVLMDCTVQQRKTQSCKVETCLLFNLSDIRTNLVHVYMSVHSWLQLKVCTGKIVKVNGNRVNLPCSFECRRLHY